MSGGAGAPAGAGRGGGDLAGRTVLVTGGTGFIGGRLVERLIDEHGARVRVLVRDLRRAYRLARHPVEIVHADVADPAAVRTAAAGCDTIFHCAYGNSGTERQQARINVGGTRSVVEAALAARVRRVVHLSTLMVYGATPDGDLDESAPRRRYGNAYSDSKLAAEQLALRLARGRGAPVVVLQPTAVYGPWGGVWTEAVLRSLQSGRMILVDGGRGTANAVYVDDLVDAMLAAATVPGVEGEAFLVSGPEAVSWHEFLARFERMLGPEPRTVAMSAEEAIAHWRAHRRRLPSALPRLVGVLRQPTTTAALAGTREVAYARLAGSRLPFAVQGWIKGIVKRRLARSDARAAAAGPAAPPILPMQPLLVRFFAARTRVRVDKAARLLGWTPRVDLATGMARTEAWARWANIVP